MANYKTACLLVAPESVERCIETIKEFVAYVRNHESGTIVYLSLIEDTDAYSFLNVMISTNNEAEQTQRHSEAAKTFTENLYSRLNSRGAAVECDAYRMVATRSE